MTKRAANTADQAENAISLRAYARRRGVSVEAVRRAIKSERLRRSVGKDARGRPRIVDPDLADREWSDNTDLSRHVKDEPRDTERDTESDTSSDTDGADEPQLSPEMSLADATRADKYWSAKRRQLEYEVRRGELIPVDEVLREFADAAAAVKAKLRRIPDAIAEKLVLAAKRGPTHVKALLLVEIDEALRELAKEGDQDAPEDAA